MRTIPAGGAVVPPSVVTNITRPTSPAPRPQDAAGSLTGASADSVAQVILSILPGFLLNLALLGPSGATGFPDAIRVLWPGPEFGLPG